MTTSGILQIIIYLVVLIALAKPLGLYMARVFEGKRTFLDRVVGPVERLIYRLSGIRPDEEMDWKKYAIAMLAFNVLGLVAVYVIQRVQGLLPLNPAGLGAPSPELSFNTATSFATNTNWQAYGGETTLSYLTQIIALTVQNFVSAATGMAILAAVIRGFVRHNAQTIGNFWADMARHVIHSYASGNRPFALARFAGRGADVQSA
jgi:K+-transporting ATPase ATPase A chain